MKALEYIIDSIEKFLDIEPKYRIRCKYEELSSTYFVEITDGNPKVKLTDNYLDWEYDLFVKFMKRYKQDEICFISDDPIITLDEIMEGGVPDYDSLKDYRSVNACIEVEATNDKKSISITYDGDITLFNSEDQEVLLNAATDSTLEYSSVSSVKSRYDSVGIEELTNSRNASNKLSYGNIRINPKLRGEFVCVNYSDSCDNYNDVDDINIKFAA